MYLDDVGQERLRGSDWIRTTPAWRLASDLKLWALTWRNHHHGAWPPNRARVHYGFARQRAFANWPLHGNARELLREGRLELGDGVLVSPHVLLEAHRPGRIVIGEGTFLNVAVQVAAVELVEIGVHCMFAHGCFIADHDHRFDDVTKPLGRQGKTSRGPVRIGDHVWCGANVVITSGVTIGERCVIGANSVVTRDLPPYSVAVGAPAKAIASIAPDEQGAPVA